MRARCTVLDGHCGIHGVLYVAMAERIKTRIPAVEFLECPENNLPRHLLDGEIINGVVETGALFSG